MRRTGWWWKEEDSIHAFKQPTKTHSPSDTTSLDRRLQSVTFRWNFFFLINAEITADSSPHTIRLIFFFISKSLQAPFFPSSSSSFSLFQRTVTYSQPAMRPNSIKTDQVAYGNLGFIVIISLKPPFIALPFYCWNGPLTPFIPFCSSVTLKIYNSKCEALSTVFVPSFDTEYHLRKLSHFIQEHREIQSHDAQTT